MKLISIFITVVMLFSTVSFGKQTYPLKKKVATSKPMPIDGLYSMTIAWYEGMKKMFGVIGGTQKVKFEKGIAYYTSTSFWDRNAPDGKILLKNIRKITDIKYKARYYLDGEGSENYEVTILVEGNNLVLNTPPLGIVKARQKMDFELIE